MAKFEQWTACSCQNILNPMKIVLDDTGDDMLDIGPLFCFYPPFLWPYNKTLIVSEVQFTYSFVYYSDRDEYLVVGFLHSRRGCSIYTCGKVILWNVKHCECWSTNINKQVFTLLMQVLASKWKITMYMSLLPHG